MKIFNIEAANMGNNQQEIANWILEEVADVDFKTESQFLDSEGDYITRACLALGWDSAPQTGGLEVNWDSEDGNFS